MKLMIASDLHGSATYTARLLTAFSRENPQKLLLLGDLLYHGPRNDLPDGYAPKTVIEQLSSVKDRLLCVRGNCEAEVDQMVLPFPVMADYALLSVDDRVWYATHGHLADPDRLPPLSAGDVFLFGHTHIPCRRETAGVWCLNPGSVSLPKEHSPHGYLLYEDGVFTWKTVDGEPYDTLTL